MGTCPGVLTRVACLWRCAVTLIAGLSWLTVAVLLAADSPLAIPVTAIVWLAHVFAACWLDHHGLDRD